MSTPLSDFQQPQQSAWKTTQPGQGIMPRQPQTPEDIYKNGNDPTAPKASTGGGFAQNLLSLLGFGGNGYADQHPIQNGLFDAAVGGATGLGVGALTGNMGAGGIGGMLGSALGGNPLVLQWINDAKKKKKGEDELASITADNKMWEQQNIRNQRMNQNPAALGVPLAPVATPQQV